MSSSITAENKQTPAGIQEQNQENSKQTLGTPISFQFQPFNYEKSQHYIQKSDESGKQRKYICGISSGVKIDHHNERMTEKCIKSFMDQTNNGQLLLYPDIHGIKSSKDIGILTKSEILGDGDWYTEYRLYDEDDDVDTESLQTAKKIWKKYYFNHKKTKAFYYNPITKKVYIPEEEVKSLLSKKEEIKYTGESYNKLVKEILAKNIAKINNRVLQLNSESWNNSLKKITTEEKKFIMPTYENIFPKISLSILKAAKDGELLKNTLKNALTKNLRESLKNFTPSTGEQSYLIRRGELAGKINPKLIKEFQKKITETFQGYTLKDPRFEVPGNIKTIAVTEIRSSINPLKKIYADELLERNKKTLELKKEWIHNRHLSRMPRRGHMRLNHKNINYNEKFEIPVYKKIGQRYYISNYIECDHPHDPNLPLSEFIGCNCDWVITAKKI